MRTLLGGIAIFIIAALSQIAAARSSSHGSRNKQSYPSPEIEMRDLRAEQP